MSKVIDVRMKKYATEIIGWYGAVAILTGYALNSFNLVNSNDLLFQLLNLTGALGIVIVSFAKGATQPAVLNLFWLAIALVVIVQILTS